MPIIPIFVSSTFKDFHIERDALRSDVAPRLNQVLAPFAAKVEFLDLRWGVDTSGLGGEEEAERLVLSVCQKEIERTRPLFVGLLGQRFGWIPASVPGSADAGPAEGHRRLSVTAWECLQGMREDSEAVFAVRTLKGAPAAEWVDQDGAAVAWLHHQVKGATQMSGGRLRLCDYTLTVHGESVVQADVDWFVTLMFEALEPVVVARARDIAGIPYSPYEAAVRERVESRTSTFVGREAEIAAVIQRLQSQSALALEGPSGMGKTSLLLRIAEHFQDSGWQVVRVLVGAGPDSTSSEEVIRLALSQLPTTPMPVTTGELWQSWREALAGLPQRTLVIVDGLDRLDAGPDREALELIRQVPAVSGGRLLVSTASDEQARLLEAREIELFNLGKFDPATVPQVVAAHLRQTGRVLPYSAVRHLAATPRSGIWVQMAVDALNWLSYTDFQDAERMQSPQTNGATAMTAVVTRAAASVPDSESALALSLVDRAAAELGQEGSASAFLLALALARSGITPEDLAAIAGVPSLHTTRARWSLGSQVCVVGHDGRLALHHGLVASAITRRWPDGHSAVHAAIADRLATRPVAWDADPSPGLDRVWHALFSSDPQRLADALSAALAAWMQEPDDPSRSNLQTRVAGVLVSGILHGREGDALGVLEGVFRLPNANHRAAAVFLIRASNVDFPLTAQMRERLVSLVRKGSEDQDRQPRPRGLLRRLRRVFVLDREDTLRLVDECISLQLEARACLEQGRVQAADPLARRALRIAQDVASTDPPQVVLHRELGDALVLLATVRLAALDYREAGALLERAAQVRVGLFEQTGSDLDADKLAALQIQYSNWARATGQEDFACGAARQAVQTYRRLAQGKNPSSCEVRDLSAAINTLLKSLIETQELDEADDLAEQSVSIARTQFSEARDQATATSLFSALDVRGQVCEARGDFRKALSVYGTLTEHYNLMSEAFPASAEMRRLQLIVYDRILAIHLAAGDKTPEHLAVFEKKLAVAKRNQELDDSPQTRRDLAFAWVSYVHALVLRDLDATHASAEAGRRLKELRSEGDVRADAAIAELQRILRNS